MARGRLYWSVGSGGFPGDFEPFGIDAQGRAAPGDPRGASTSCWIWNDPKPGVYRVKHWEFRVPAPQGSDIRLGLHLRRAGGRIRRSAWPACPQKVRDAGHGGRAWLHPHGHQHRSPRASSSHLAGGQNRPAKAAVGRTADRGTWRIARDVYIAETSARARREVLERHACQGLAAILPSRCSGRPGCSRSPKVGRSRDALTTGSRPVPPRQHLDRRRPRSGHRQAPRRSSARSAASEGSGHRPRVAAARAVGELDDLAPRSCAAAYL